MVFAHVLLATLVLTVVNVLQDITDQLMALANVNIHNNFFYGKLSLCMTEFN